MQVDLDPTMLLNEMAEGLYVVDRHRKIAYWNAAAESIAGFTAAEVAGRCCGDDLLDHVGEAGERLCGDMCPLLATIADGLPRHMRVRLRHKDGSLIPVRVSARALRNEEGEITGAVETFVDDSRLEAAEGRLKAAERLLNTDHLTGSGSRRFLEARLADRLPTADAPGRACAVLVIDIDHFKTYNDDYGHTFGDVVLRSVSDGLRRVAGHEADVARCGGDEFVIVTGDLSARELEAMAHDVRRTVAGIAISDGEVRVRATVSVGVATSRVGDTPTSIVQRADDAMLEAKRGGRDAVVVSAGDVGPRRMSRPALGSEANED